MEMEITSTDAKPLLHRTEVWARITFQGATPSRKEVVAGIAKATKSKKELVIVRSIDMRYGNQEATIGAFVYDSKEALDTLERESAKKKHVFEEKTADEKKEEQPAEEKPVVEAAPEEKKESAKSEEKAPEKREEAPVEEKAEKAEEQPADEKKGDD